MASRGKKKVVEPFSWSKIFTDLFHWFGADNSLAASLYAERTGNSSKVEEASDRYFHHRKFLEDFE